MKKINLKKANLVLFSLTILLFGFGIAIFVLYPADFDYYLGSIENYSDAANSVISITAILFVASFVFSILYLIFGVVLFVKKKINNKFSRITLIIQSCVLAFVFIYYSGIAVFIHNKIPARIFALAVMPASVEVFKKELENIEDVNELDSTGVSLIDMATALCNYEVTEALIKKGVDFNKPTGMGTLPIHAIFLSSVISEDNKTYDHKKCLKIIDLFVKSGTSLNTNMPNTNTRPLNLLLILTAHQEKYGVLNHMETKGYLSKIEYNYHTTYENQNNATPLILTIQNRDIKLVSMLIKHGADVNMPDTDGKTPLDYAIENPPGKLTKTHKGTIRGVEDDKKIAELLIKHGAKKGAELKKEQPANAKN